MASLYESSYIDISSSDYDMHTLLEKKTQEHNKHHKHQRQITKVKNTKYHVLSHSWLVL